MTLCQMVYSYHCFRGACFLQFQDRPSPRCVKSCWRNDSVTQEKYRL